MKHLTGLKWTGDLSLQDADVLARYGKNSKNVLEFGCGGSTQILAQVCSKVVSIETVPAWIDVVKKRLGHIADASPVNFHLYDDPMPDQRFDLIFVDGDKTRRFAFAAKMWEKLNKNRFMLFHDTKKDWGTDLIKRFISLKFGEIGIISINDVASDGRQSNITCIQKREQTPYINWQTIEGKPKWAYGSDVSVDDIWEFKG